MYGGSKVKIHLENAFVYFRNIINVEYSLQRT